MAEKINLGKEAEEQYVWVISSRNHKILLGHKLSPKPSYVFKGEDMSFKKLSKLLGDDASLISEIPIIISAANGCNSVVSLITDRLESIN